MIPLLLLLSAMLSSCGGDGGEERPQLDVPAMDDTTPPTTPQGVIAQTQSATDISLSWDASTDDTGIREYVVFRDGARVGTAASAAGSSSSALLFESQTLGGDNLSRSNVSSSLQSVSAIPVGELQLQYTDSSLSPNTRYCYEVMAVDNVGNESLLSNVSFATTEVTVEESGSCGSGLPLLVSNFTVPDNIRASFGYFGSVNYQGSYSSIINPRMVTKRQTSKGRNAYSLPTNDTPTVTYDILFLCW